MSSCHRTMQVTSWEGTAQEPKACQHVFRKFLALATANGHARSRASRSSRARSAHAKCLVKSGLGDVLQVSVSIPRQESARANSLRRSCLEPMEWRYEPGFTLLLGQCQERQICCSQNLEVFPSRSIRSNALWSISGSCQSRQQQAPLPRLRQSSACTHGGGGKVSKLGAAAKASSSSCELRAAQALLGASGIRYQGLLGETFEHLQLEWHGAFVCLQPGIEGTASNG